MTTDPKVPGGDAQNPGGNSEDQNETQPKAPAKDSVAYDTYKKAVDEAKAAKAKVAEFEKAQREANEAKLKADGEYKKLLEQREKELADERQKRTGIEQQISDARKRSALLDALTGEVPKTYWSLMDLDEIAVNPETGMPDEASVKSVAEKFEKQYPEVVKRAPKGKLPNDAPQGGGAKLSYASWLKLPVKEQLERMKDVDKSTM